VIIPQVLPAGKIKEEEAPFRGPFRLLVSGLLVRRYFFALSQVYALCVELAWRTYGHFVNSTREKNNSALSDIIVFP